MWQLQGIDSEDFVRHYWQKKPCLIRNAFDNFETPVSPEELAGLACEEEVHCRLVIEKDGESPWQLRYGPFEEEDFLDLPASHYSLLVSECEKWFPDLAEILDQFRFIPDWRVDDLMLSYAPEQGSVGPHVDQYDVFLLQALGQRRWQYTDNPVENPVLIPDLELAILQEFTPDQELILNPGDMLYLPPGIAHHGVALERCMTFSIGFRAPTAAAALESFALETGNLGISDKRYRDADLELDRHSSEITNRKIEKFKSLILDLFDQPQSLWNDCVGKLLSDSAVTTPEETEQPVYISDLQACAWLRHPETRMLYHLGGNALRLYCNGRAYDLPADQQIIDCVQQLCEQREWPLQLMHRCIALEPMQTLLVELASRGAILPFDE